MKQYKVPSIDQSLGVKSMVHETQPMSMAISSTSPRTIQFKSRKRSQNSMQVANVLIDETLPTSMAISSTEPTTIQLKSSKEVLQAVASVVHTNRWAVLQTLTCLPVTMNTDRCDTLNVIELQTLTSLLKVKHTSTIVFIELSCLPCPEQPLLHYSNPELAVVS
jgi:hypothetical protein